MSKKDKKDKKGKKGKLDEPEETNNFLKSICQLCDPWQKCLLYSVPIFIALPYLIRKMACPPWCSKANKCFKPPPGCCHCKECPKPPCCRPS